MQTKLENTNIQSELRAGVVGWRNSLLFTYLNAGLACRKEEKNLVGILTLFFYTTKDFQSDNIIKDSREGNCDLSRLLLQTYSAVRQAFSGVFSAF